MKRNYEDWLTTYLKYTENSEPPRQFKLWTGISTIAACLQRKCYTRWESLIYPNLYVAIVGPSGCRKGTAMGPALNFLQQLGVNLAAESITREALIRTLSSSTATIINENGTQSVHCSLTIYSPELAVFIGYENKSLISSLTDWFDCRERWSYHTKNQGEDDLIGVWVNLIGATTPDLLRSILPQDAIGGGLTSRMIFVYGAEKSRIVPDPRQTPAEIEMGEKLLEDLEVILTLCGEFAISTEYMDAYQRWYVEQCKVPAISDHNFAPYLERRPLHIRKVSMVVSASRSNDMILTLDDFLRAESFLTDAEGRMPNVFRGYGKVETAELFPRLMGVITSMGTVPYGTLAKQFYRDVKLDDLDRMLLSLQAMGFAEVRYLKDSNGRVVEKFVVLLEDK